MGLQAVPDPDDRRSSIPPPTQVPRFHGKEVSSVKMKLTSIAGLECPEKVLEIDQIVRITIEGRVSGVNHVVNEKNGDLDRIQTIKAIDVEFTPWNPDDPDDDGVMR